jgi:hypothetical protein
MTKKYLIITSIIIAIALFFTACSSNVAGDSMMNYPATNEKVEIENDVVLDGEMSNNSDAITPDGSGSSNTNTENNAQKIIQIYNYTTETTEFDNAITKLEKEVANQGGYIEKSNVYGNNSRYNKNRNAFYTIRIPKNNTDNFIGQIDTMLTVMQKSVETKDVTSQYVDIESRLSALRKEQAALEALLAKATTMSDVLKIQSELTDVIYEIESYEARIRVYDNLIEYKTIHLEIEEVLEPTPTEEPSFWEEMSEKFSNSVDSAINGLGNFCIFIVSALPHLGVFVIINLPAVIVLVFLIKRNKKKKQKQKNIINTETPANKKK